MKNKLEYYDSHFMICDDKGGCWDNLIYFPQINIIYDYKNVNFKKRYYGMVKDILNVMKGL